MKHIFLQRPCNINLPGEVRLGNKGYDVRLDFIINTNVYTHNLYTSQVFLPPQILLDTWSESCEEIVTVHDYVNERINNDAGGSNIFTCKLYT